MVDADYIHGEGEVHIPWLCHFLQDSSEAQLGSTLANSLLFAGGAPANSVLVAGVAPNTILLISKGGHLGPLSPADK